MANREKYLDRQRRYNQSEKGRPRQQRYNATERGVARDASFDARKIRMSCGGIEFYIGVAPTVEAAQYLKEKIKREAPRA